MEIRVTLDMLIKAEACGLGRRRFVGLFGESVALTPEIITSDSVKLDWGWAAEHLLDWEIFQDKYLVQVDPALGQFFLDRAEAQKTNPQNWRNSDELIEARNKLNTVRATIFIELATEHGLSSNFTKEEN
jgi:hypothetical protein